MTHVAQHYQPQPVNHLHIFHDFYYNPVIQQLAVKPYWSVSDDHKRPVDMFKLRTYGIIRPCCITDPGAMTTLPEVLRILQYQPANHAFYIDAVLHEYMVLDIESSCPQELKDQLLTTIPAYYAETSMSGKGIHLVLPLPTNMGEYPNAVTKPALKMKDKSYEILLNHWVTFTRNTIPDDQYLHFDPDDPAHQQVIDDLFASLAQDAQKTYEMTLTIDETELSIDNIPHADLIMTYLTKANNYTKTLAEFDGDHSRFETGFMFFKLKKLKTLLKNTAFCDHEYTESEQIALLYHISKECLPSRAKHEEYRAGLPWLAYLARSVVNTSLHEEQSTHSQEGIA